MSDDKPRITEQTYDIYCDPDDIVPPELGGGTVQQLANLAQGLEKGRDRWRDIARVLHDECYGAVVTGPREAVFRKAMRQAFSGTLDPDPE